MSLPGPIMLEYPFEEALHPQAEALRTYANDWVRRMGLVTTPQEIERFDSAAYWRLIAGAYPTGSWEFLTLAHDWNAWGFFLDDLDDASAAAREPETLRQLFATILAILEGAPAGTKEPPLLQALRHVWQRIHLRSSPTWRRRFRETLANGMAAYHWEAHNRASGQMPSLTDYLSQRRHTGGWLTDLLLVDLAQDRTLAEEVYGSPPVQQALEAANNIICWANDLYSFSKEARLGEVHNLVQIVKTTYQCELEAAQQMVVAWHNLEVLRWQYWAAQVPALALAPAEASHLRAYLAFCEHFITANARWSQLTSRYQ
jgi:hypothetical protein